MCEWAQCPLPGDLLVFRRGLCRHGPEPKSATDRNLNGVLKAAQSCPQYIMLRMVEKKQESDSKSEGSLQVTHNLKHLCFRNEETEMKAS